MKDVFYELDWINVSEIEYMKAIMLGNGIYLVPILGTR